MKSKFSAALTALLLIVLLTLSFHKNIFSVVPAESFSAFQHDSETLVLGRIIADENNKALPLGAGIGFVGISDFIYIPEYILQSYQLIGRKTLEPLTLRPAPLNDDNWTEGVSRHSARIVVLGSGLDRYVGRKVDVQGDVRTIKAVKYNYQYANLDLTGDLLRVDRTVGSGVTVKISGDPVDPSTMKFVAYPQQYGVQGALFSGMYKVLSQSLVALNFLNSFAFAVVVVALVFLYSKVISLQFAVFFLLSVAFSPWLVAFGRNLYWIPFAWFLPAALAISLFFSRTPRQEILVCIFLFCAFVFRFLAGYEYLTSVILFAAAPFVYLAVVAAQREARVLNLKRVGVIFSIGVVAFIVALLIHATVRGDTVWQGLQSIYEVDVKRRTYGDPSRFDPLTAASLTSSPVGVLMVYVNSWTTNLVKTIPGGWFPFMLLWATAVLVYRWIGRNIQWRADTALFFVFLIVPLSWFVLAKGHSFIHTQLNFVLWYFGFVAALLHVSFNGFKLTLLGLGVWMRKHRMEEI
ncbi:hypothetical protein [Pseudorhodoferax sp. Leaf274]|uniref:hypothetical protein n=1 Tax=Pseudorhodoferax sp. Leaf274 TaxID=1736318 RepID=UPI0012E1A58E|nr:hypothetical protein [Pseudorhodoferax sp. Leaf274]